MKIELMHRYHTKIKSNEFLMSTTTLVSGSIINQFLLLIAFPILSNIFGPKYFGLNAVFISWQIIVSSFSSLMFDRAIVLPKNEIGALILYYLSLISSGIVSIILFLILIGARYLGYIPFDVNDPVILFGMLSISVFLFSLQSSNTYLANRRKEYRLMVYNSILYTLFSVGLNMIFGLLGIKEYGLIIGGILAQIIVNIYLIKYLKPFSGKKIGNKRLIVVFRKYIDFPRYQTPASFLNTISLQVPIILLAYFFGNTVVGWYSICQRVLNMPMTIVGSTMGQVYYKEAVERVHNGNELSDFTWNIMKKSFLMAFIPMTLIIGFGDQLFNFVFGPDWYGSGVYARMLAIWILLVFVAGPIQNIILIKGKLKQNMYINLIMFLSRFISIWVGAIFFHSDYKAMAIFGASGILLWLGMFCYIIYLVKIPFRKFVPFTTLYFVLLIVPVLLIRSLLGFF